MLKDFRIANYVHPLIRKQKYHIESISPLLSRLKGKIRLKGDQDISATE